MQALRCLVDTSRATDIRWQCHPPQTSKAGVAWSFSSKLDLGTLSGRCPCHNHVTLSHRVIYGDQAETSPAKLDALLWILPARGGGQRRLADGGSRKVSSRLVLEEEDGLAKRGSA